MTTSRRKVDDVCNTDSVSKEAITHSNIYPYSMD